MIVLIPAAGNGSRFREAGWKTLKPLIKVRVLRNPPILMMRAALWRTDPMLQVYCGVKPQHVEDFTQAIHDFRWTIVAAPRWKFGQSLTLLDICDVVPDLDQECLVYNSDVVHDFNPNEFLVHARTVKANCSLTVIPSQNPSFSYVNRSPFFDYALEKVVMTDLSITGLYYFRKVSLFRDALLRQFREDQPSVNGEFYLSEMLRWIPEPRAVFRVEASKVYDLGTPEKLTMSKSVEAVVL